MNTPTQIEIIKRFGDKEHCVGCLLFEKDSGIIIVTGANDLKTAMVKPYYAQYVTERKITLSDFEILGHIPHLEDVFRVAEEKKWGMKVLFLSSRTHYIQVDKPLMTVVNYNPTLNLLDQPESTLQELLSLFPNE